MVFGDAATSSATQLGRTVTALAEIGRRTLVLGHADAVLSEADVDAERLPEGLKAIIVLTFREQVRPDAAQTLAYFGRQQVGIRIISGDNPRTVAAIAREVGLDVAEGSMPEGFPTMMPNSPTCSTGTRCSDASHPSRRSAWSRRCRATGTPSR